MIMEPFQVENLSADQFIEFLRAFRQFLHVTVPACIDVRVDTDLITIRDEMVSKVNTTLYLASLH